MKLALTVDCWQDEQLMFAQQFGVTHIVAETALPKGDGRGWDARALTALHNRVEKAGLALAGMDCLPHRMASIVLGDASRDAEIDSVCRFVRDAGRAGVPFVGYVWSAAGHAGSQARREGRGGVSVRSCGTDLPGRAGATPTSIEAESSWENLAYFLKRVIPVADEAGVRMAYRPTDPLASAGAPEALFSSVRALARVPECAPSPANALDLWPCALSAMEGADPSEAVRFLDAEGRIALLTVQNLCGRFPDVSEACIDAGDTEIVAVLRACRDAGFRGFLRPGPQPAMTDDTPWGHMAQAFAVGYLRSLLQEVEHMERIPA